MSRSISSDAELIAGCIAGDKANWNSLIERYSRFIYAIVLQMGLPSADADDVFQNVCVRLYQNLSGLRNSDRLSTWLAVTTRHEVSAWSRMRRNTAFVSEMTEQALQTDGVQLMSGDTESDPEAIVLALETQHIVRLCMDHLPAECRDLLTLLYNSDAACSYSDAARSLNMPIGSIGPKRARCLKRLEKLLRDFGY